MFYDCCYLLQRCVTVCTVCVWLHIRSQCGRSIMYRRPYAGSRFAMLFDVGYSVCSTSHRDPTPNTSSHCVARMPTFIHFIITARGWVWTMSMRIIYGLLNAWTRFYASDAGSLCRISAPPRKRVTQVKMPSSDPVPLCVRVTAMSAGKQRSAYCMECRGWFFRRLLSWRERFGPGYIA
jgi:hypothetical protein